MQATPLQNNAYLTHCWVYTRKQKSTNVWVHLHELQKATYDCFM